jgi:hypothetical protein
MGVSLPTSATSPTTRRHWSRGSTGGHLTWEARRPGGLWAYRGEASRFPKRVEAEHQLYAEYATWRTEVIDLSSNEIGDGDGPDPMIGGPTRVERDRERVD